MNFPNMAVNATTLESQVALQLSGEAKYTFEENKALLKYYNLNPEQIKEEIVSNVFVLSLMALPSTDFLALSYVLPVGKGRINSKLAHIRSCYESLDKCNFFEFWSKVSSAEEIFAAAVNFYRSIRLFILGVLRQSATSLTLENFQRSLNITSSDMTKFQVEHLNIFQVQGESVVFVAAESKKSHSDDSARVAEVLRLMDSVRAASETQQ